jgi:uncharacterized protein YdaT
MPWKASEASSKTKKANTPKRKRAWRKIANKSLKSGYSEASAIRIANAAIHKVDSEIEAILAGDWVLRRKIQQYDPFGREAGSYTENEESDSMRARDEDYEIASAKASTRAGGHGDAAVPGGHGGSPQTPIAGTGFIRNRPFKFRKLGHRERPLAPARRDAIPSIFQILAGHTSDAAPVIVLGGATPPTPPTPNITTHQHFMLFDDLTIDEAAKVRITPDGYLTAMPRVARVGIQIYNGVRS